MTDPCPKCDAVSASERLQAALCQEYHERVLLMGAENAELKLRNHELTCRCASLAERLRLAEAKAG